MRFDSVNAPLSELPQRAAMLLYDPPSGWMYGFPKPYRPRDASETLAETLLRDGYPLKEIVKITHPDGRLIGVRFLGTKEEINGL